MEVYEGVLKQQCQNEHDEYEWRQKHFALDIANGLLQVESVDEPNPTKSQLSVYGATHAKEWAYSSALAGFGFDVVWSTGVLWSFLVESEEQCKNWVNAINKSIESINGKTADVKPTYYDELENTTALYSDVTQPQPHSRHDFNDSRVHPNTSFHAVTPWLTLTNNDLSNSFVNNTADTTGPLDITTDVSTNYHPNGFPSLHHRHEFVDTSTALSRVDYIDLPYPEIKFDYNSSAYADDSGVDEVLTRIRQNADAAARSLESSRLDATQDLHSKQYSKVQTLVPLASKANRYSDSDNEYESGREAALDNEKVLLQQVAHLKTRIQELDSIAHQRRVEVESLQEQTRRLRHENEMRAVDLQRQLDEAWARERKIMQETQAQLESKLLSACNDNTTFHESAAKAAALQHSRELACAREELALERKNANQRLQREITQRRAVEATDQALRAEVNQLRDQVVQQQIDHNRLAEQLHNDLLTAQREHKRVAAEHTSKLATLQEDKQQVITQMQTTLQQKIHELNEKFERSVNNIQQHDHHRLQQQFEFDRLAAITEMQRKCAAEIEVVRAEERKLAAIEIDKIRSTFLQREHRTADDLIELEKLHARRVSSLEEQNVALKRKLEATESQLTNAYHTAMNGSEVLQQRVQELTTQLRRQEQQITHLNTQLSDLNATSHASKAAELSHRQQAATALEQQRLATAEALQLKQQVSKLTAQVAQYQQIAKQCELSLQAHNAVQQIAVDESALQALELDRLRLENSELMQCLVKSERLIYGVPQHEIDHLRSRGVRVDHLPLCRQSAHATTDGGVLTNGYSTTTSSIPRRNTNSIPLKARPINASRFNSNNNGRNSGRSTKVDFNGAMVINSHPPPPPYHHHTADDLRWRYLSNTASSLL